MKKVSPLVLVLAVVGSLWAAAPARGRDVDITIADGILDWIHLEAERAPQDAPIIVHLFDVSEADLGTGAVGGKPKRVQAAKTMQAEGPPILAEELVANLRKLGPFPEAGPADGQVPEDALIVEGRFTTLDPGSKAKRYFAGFGAGKGVVEIEGTVKDSAGNVLAEFRHKRLTVIGAFGGDYKAKMRADCERFGKDVARFMNAWATGKKLTD